VIGPGPGSGIRSVALYVRTKRLDNGGKFCNKVRVSENQVMGVAKLNVIDNATRHRAKLSTQPYGGAP